MPKTDGSPKAVFNNFLIFNGDVDDDVEEEVEEVEAESLVEKSKDFIASLIGFLIPWTIDEIGTFVQGFEDDLIEVPFDNEIEVSASSFNAMGDISIEIK